MRDISNTRIMVYTNDDFEQFYVRYKMEAVPEGISLQSYCSKSKVPYNLFMKWFKDTRHKVVQVQVDGIPNPESPSAETSSDIESNPATVSPKPTKCVADPVRIKIEVKVSNGLYISMGNMSYPELKRLVENLEVLC